MKKDEWEVKADLPGFEKPAKIGETHRRTPPNAAAARDTDRRRMSA